MDTLVTDQFVATGENFESSTRYKQLLAFLPVEMCHGGPILD